MLAIAGGKGGCGKTTATLCLADALARRGFDPLVLDGDCDMPDVHHRVGLDNAGGIDALASTNGLRETIQVPHELPGVSVVTGGQRNTLGTALQRARDWHGPVLVDCAAGLGPDAVRSLRHADRTLLVTTASPQCLDDTRQTRTVTDRLGTASVGVLLRETPAQDAETEPRDLSVIARLPHVDAPLDSPRLRQAYLDVSRTAVPAQTDQNVWQ